MILTRKISISEPVWRDLNQIKAELKAERGRDVWMSETLEVLIAHWRASGKLGDDVREAQ